MKSILLVLIGLSYVLTANWYIYPDNVSGNIHAINEDYITETNPSGTGASMVNIWFVIGAQQPQFDETNFSSVKTANSISGALNMIFPVGEFEWWTQVKKHNVQQSEDYLIFYDSTSGAGWHVMPQDRLIITLAANSSDPGSYMAHLWFSWGPIRPPMFFTTDATRLQFAGDYVSAVDLMLKSAGDKEEN